MGKYDTYSREDLIQEIKNKTGKINDHEIAFATLELHYVKLKKQLIKANKIIEEIEKTKTIHDYVGTVSFRYGLYDYLRSTLKIEKDKLL